MADPLWVGYPRSYTKGRNRPVQFVVLHYTAGSEGPTSAEAGARYDKVRTDGTSTHYFVDSEGPALQEVPDGDRAHAARLHGNEIGIQIEMCGTAQTRAQWLDDASMATMRTTAELVALLLRRHNLAFRRLTVAETRAAYYAPTGQRPTGIVEHATCTLAFPEDGGDHMDLGAGFPWDVFTQMVKDAAMGGGNVMAVIVQWPPEVKGSLCFSNGSELNHIPGVTELNQIKAGWPGIQTVDATKWPADVVHKLYGPDGPAWGVPPTPESAPGATEMAAIAKRVAHDAIAATTLTPPTG